MTEQSLRILFEKYLSGSLTEAEFTTLWKTLQEPEHQEKWGELAETIWRNKQYHYAADEETRTKILSRLQPHISGSKETVVPINKKRTWWAVAAAAVLLLGISSYWIMQYTRQETENTVSRNASGNKIVPGTNKAILTLNSGVTVELDSAAEGVLAKQAGLDIIKNKKGELLYHGVVQSEKEVAYNTVTTPRGGQYKVILPDGTTVWLNAASSITYPVGFTGDERKVAITGEAYFEVAKDAVRPFRVGLKDMTIEVLGTHFNIMGYEDEINKTTLLEGAVSIILENKKTLLKPGQQASIDDARNVKVLDNADVDEAVAWKNGLFSFNSVNIETIMRQAARWYNVEVEFSKKCTVSFSGGITRSAAIEDFLAIMSETEKVKFDIRDHKIIVIPL
ncbi:MAG: FecR domain-containing protein [Chitinophagaceae bacterium]|nr:FecR domain-containing protein [Chitinophagaceae bacterium]